jgi:hypothetical protein
MLSFIHVFVTNLPTAPKLFRVVPGTLSRNATNFQTSAVEWMDERKWLLAGE